MPLFRLAFFGLLPQHFMANEPAMNLEFNRLVRRTEYLGAAAQLTGAIIVGTEYLGSVIEGRRGAVSEAFLRFASEGIYASVTLVGAERIEAHRFSGFSVTPISHESAETPFRPDLMTFAELTSFASLAVDDIMDIGAKA